MNEKNDAQDAVESAIQELSSSELVQCWHSANRIIGAKDSHERSIELKNVISNELIVIPAKSISIYLFGLYLRSSASGRVGTAVLKRELDRLKSLFRIRAVRLDLPFPPEDDLSSGGEVNADEVSNAVKLVYKSTVNRVPGEEEVTIWKNNLSNGLNFMDFLLLMARSDEAQQNNSVLFPEIPDGRFIQLLYVIFEERFPLGIEIDQWADQILSGLDRRTMLTQFFRARTTRLLVKPDSEPRTETEQERCYILGTNRILTRDEWNLRRQELASGVAKPYSKEFSRFSIKRSDRILATAIASMYCGGDFIEQFMENMITQTTLKSCSELIIIDACSPENEIRTIEKYLKSHPNIVYKRYDYKIGIYEAWNEAVALSRGKYLTNTNLDDLRRRDSLECQIAALEALPFVDVVYQDFFYSFEPHLKFEEVANCGFVSDLPIVDAKNLQRFNSPHNAPMWRRSLHRELGLFDGSYRSAGDYEFWMRCCAAGKNFYKLNDPHVVYYQNPKGLSTKADSAGYREARQISRKYGGTLTSKAEVCSKEEFSLELGLVSRPPRNTPKYDAAQARLRELSIISRNLVDGAK